MQWRATSTTETSFEKGVVVVDDDENEPISPVVNSETKRIKATVAECPNMNYLLQRSEMGESLDLSAQFAILESSDSILCGIQNNGAEPSNPQSHNKVDEA